MKVKIISGTYGWRPEEGGSVESVPKGATCDVSDYEAARLVNLGVAVYADKGKPTDTVITTSLTCASNNPGSDIPNGRSVTAAHRTGENDEPTLEIVGGHYTVESLVQLTRKKLEEMADALGVDATAVKKCTSKGSIAALIAAVEVADGDEEPPQPTVAIPGT